MELKVDPEFKTLIPSLSEDEYKQLEESILSEGCRDALVLWDGVLIDGHNRYEICTKHGIPFKTTEKPFESRNDVEIWMLQNQLGRRNLNSYVKADLILQLEERFKAIGKENQKLKSFVKQVEISKDGSPNSVNHVSKYSPMDSQKELAKIAGVSHDTIARVKAIKEKAPEQLKNKVKSGEISINQAYTEVKRIDKLAPEQLKKVLDKVETGEAKNIKEAVSFVKQEEINTLKDSIVLPDPIKIIQGDFREVYQTLEKESVDFIITDPPYPKEYLPLYDDLAKCAERVLKPGGSLIMMIGQSYLPEIIQTTVNYLNFNWMLCYFTPGPATQLWQRKVNTSWKPVLWFTKGDYKGSWIQDVIKSENRDKDFHEWGQSESGMLDLMKRFVMPGDTVLDPFLGGGTTGIICKELKCEFIGIEKDIDTFNTAKVRLGGIA